MSSSPPRSPSQQYDRESHDASETTPLLIRHVAPDAETEASTLVAPSSPSSTVVPSPKPFQKPLPKMQMFLLCYARMTEPIAFFCIFPFIAQMVQRNGHLPTSDVGFYSGLIESLFSATQMVVLIFWGRLADRIGRKPVLMYSLVGMAIGPALFGMSRTIWQMILFRCLAGLFSGSSLIIRTMIAEISTPETQARAFSWFAFAGNLGIFIGPILGGALADPVNQYPGAFKGLKFFEDYPYALPGFVTSSISATSALTSALFLKETLKKETKQHDDDTSPEPASSTPPLSTWELLKAPGVGIVLWVYGHVMFLAFAFTAILPVVLFTPVDLGGTGFSSFQISMYMAVQGGSQAVWLLLAFPSLQHRFGTKGVMKMCGVAYPFFFAGYILLNSLLREGSHAAKVWFWILGSLVAVIGPGVSMAFTGAQLALNDVSPNSQVLGTLNALALTFSSGIRAIVPGAATAIYAIGVRGQIFWGHLAWVILVPLAAAYAVACNWLPKGRPIKDDDEDEES
ncbi:Fc.00g107970.m01.CDS01 [Cosmosporella sp. VM-42]